MPDVRSFIQATGRPRKGQTAEPGRSPNSKLRSRLGPLRKAGDYLKKPFEASELVARVSAVARMKKLQDELRARNAELDIVSRTDAFTGLSNRRQLVERLVELGSASR